MTNSEITSIRISVRDVLFILFFKIRVLIGTFFVIVLLVAGHTFIADPIYKSSGDILIKPLFDSSQRLHTQERFDVLPISQQDINTEMEIMLSDTLLTQVVSALPEDKENSFSLLDLLPFPFKKDKPQSAVELAVAKLRNSLEIRPIPMSNIIKVSLKGKDPEKITKTVNTFLDRYIDRHIEVHRPGGGVDFYNKQTESAKEKLIESENALLKFQEKYSIIKIEEQRKENITLIRVLRESLSQVRSKIAESESKLSSLKPYLEQGKFEALPEEFRIYEVIIDLQKALIPILVEKERILLLYPKGSVEYQDAQNQIKSVEEQVIEEQKKIIAGMDMDLEALINQRQVLETEIQRIEKESQALTLQETELNRIMRELEQNKRNYQLYLDIREDAIIQSQKERSRVANVSVTNWAVKPVKPVYPKKFLMLCIALFVGVFAGIGCAFAAYYMDHTIKRPEDMERFFKIPVFGTISEINGETKEIK